MESAKVVKDLEMENKKVEEEAPTEVSDVSSSGALNTGEALSQDLFGSESAETDLEKDEMVPSDMQTEDLEKQEVSEELARSEQELEQNSAEIHSEDQEKSEISADEDTTHNDKSLENVNTQFGIDANAKKAVNESINTSNDGEKSEKAESGKEVDNSMEVDDTKKESLLDALVLADEVDDTKEESLAAAVVPAEAAKTEEEVRENLPYMVVPVESITLKPVEEGTTTSNEEPEDLNDDGDKSTQSSISNDIIAESEIIKEKQNLTPIEVDIGTIEKDECSDIENIASIEGDICVFGKDKCSDKDKEIEKEDSVGVPNLKTVELEEINDKLAKKIEDTENDEPVSPKLIEENLDEAEKDKLHPEVVVGAESKICEITSENKEKQKDEDNKEPASSKLIEENKDLEKLEGEKLETEKVVEADDAKIKACVTNSGYNEKQEEEKDDASLEGVEACAETPKEVEISPKEADSTTSEISKSLLDDDDVQLVESSVAEISPLEAETEKASLETPQAQIDDVRDNIKDKDLEEQLAEICGEMSPVEAEMEIAKSLLKEIDNNQNDDDKPKSQDLDMNTSETDKSSEITKSILKDFEVSENEDSEGTLSKLLENKPNENAPEMQVDGPANESSKEDKHTFIGKDCVNCECPHVSKIFFRAPLFVLSFYKIAKKYKRQLFVCEHCFDNVHQSYENLCGLLKQEQPLLLAEVTKRPDFVEIVDSSDEEETTDKAKIQDDDEFFDELSVKVFKDEIDSIISKVLADVNIRNQCTWSKSILEKKLQNVEKEAEEIAADLKKLQSKADNMHKSLYGCAKIRMRPCPAIDLNTGLSFNGEDDLSLPPIGEVRRPTIEIGRTYFGVNKKAICAWADCRVMEQAEIDTYKNLKFYRVRFDGNMTKTVSNKNLAYFNPPAVRLQIGERVIALFNTSKMSRNKTIRPGVFAYYPGVVAEPLKDTNKFRYLIFFDDGYAQYVNHSDVRLVCNASANVWEDVHPGSKDFIQNYLTQYSVNRPMIQTSCGQTMLTETNGKWVMAKVVAVDCSLVQMQFLVANYRTEWLYRGSTRLGPVFKEAQKPLETTPPPLRVPRRFEPFIRYTQDEESSNRNTTQQQPSQEVPQPPTPKPTEPRAVAKKSVSRQDSGSSSTPRQPTVKHLNNSTIFVDDDVRQGRVYHYTPKKAIAPRTYVNHTCSPTCLRNIMNPFKGFNPLAKPLLSGWERIIMKRKQHEFVAYVAPCGRRLRDMEAVRVYLRVTNNILNVDNFDFHPDINCLAEYASENLIVQNRDLSNGEEEVPIPCVNNFDNTFPPDCVYSAKRLPTAGVNLNLDEEFLVGCDCEDDCSDKSKCSCWQLTLAGAKYIDPNYQPDAIGYEYKRLYDGLTSGIYECNPRCKCASNCLNRVVQHPLTSKLQVFKTRNRGWGIRALNDIPKGGFVCIYAGHLLTESDANEGGTIAGDEYFAELDYIESAEKIKEGYESDAYLSDDDENEDNYTPDMDEDDDDFQPNNPTGTSSYSSDSRRLRTRKSQQANNGDDESERRVINFEPNTSMENNEDEDGNRSKSVRKLFGKDEACYVMDAKVSGNVGRYFNHSCSPNLFVQNVFVDTHDLRFPWVAFFAVSNIRAGSELTWNYSYEVGSVPGKVLYCECGASNCRGRLL